jgi:hypothetical protein
MFYPSSFSTVYTGSCFREACADAGAVVDILGVLLIHTYRHTCMHTYIQTYIYILHCIYQFISILIISVFRGQAKGYPKQSMDFLWTCKFKWYFGSSGLFTQLYVLLHHFYRYRIIEAVSMVPNPKVSLLFLWKWPYEKENPEYTWVCWYDKQLPRSTSRLPFWWRNIKYDQLSSQTSPVVYSSVVEQLIPSFVYSLSLYSLCWSLFTVYNLYSIYSLNHCNQFCFLFFQGSRLELPVCDADPPYICTGTCMGMGISAPHFWQFMG